MTKPTTTFNTMISFNYGDETLMVEITTADRPTMWDLGNGLDQEGYAPEDCYMISFHTQSVTV